MQPYKIINLFDRFVLKIPSELKCYADGATGNRNLVIADHHETFSVFFEEGMPMRDMQDSVRENVPAVSFQCCKDGKYIHERRRKDCTEQCAFFHIELEDDDGKTYCLPGQMTVSSGFRWVDGIEQILLLILDNITLK